MNFKNLTKLQIGVLLVALVIIAIVFASLFSRIDHGQRRKQLVFDPVVQASASMAACNSKLESSQKWQYSFERDQMRETTTRYASLTSKTPLAFPTCDGSYVTLNVQQKEGEVAEVSFSGDSIFCRLEGLPVKFDRGEVRNEVCETRISKSGGDLLISSSVNFFSDIEKSKKLVVEFTTYDDGVIQVEFDTAGFEPLKANSEPRPG